MLQRFLLWPLFAALMGFALGGSIGSAYPIASKQYAQVSQPAQSAQHGSDQASKPSSLLVPTNPTEFFTLWVAAFTLALVVVTAGFVWSGVRQVRDARILQRAYVTPSHVSPKDKPALRNEGGKWVVRIEVGNGGNTPATVQDAFVQSAPIAQGETLPPQT